MALSADRFGQWNGTTPMAPSAGLSGNYNPVPAPSNTGGGVLSSRDLAVPQSASDSDMAYKGQGPGLGGWGNPAPDDKPTPPRATDPMAGDDNSPMGHFGAGLDGAGGSGPTASGWAYDDGGVVPDGDEDDIGSDATIDPMAMVKTALAHGRKKMGLPVQFYPSNTGDANGSIEQQSFDDGGVVDDNDGDEGVIPNGDAPPTQASGSQSGPVDPRKALHYLAGGGAVSPEIANALEHAVDPQGTLSPSERKLKAVAAAGNPDAQFGVMQHYRSRFNAHSAAAKAAMTGSPGRPPNLVQSARSATEAFENVPTGSHVSFAPAQGGVMMTVQPHGAQDQALYDGGEVESENIEDRRGESYGIEFKDQGPSPEGVGGAMLANYAAGKEKPSKAGDDEGVIRKKKTPSYDDGGEVDGGEDDQPVLPTESANAFERPTMAGAQRGQQAIVDENRNSNAYSALLTPTEYQALVQKADYDRQVEAANPGFWRKFVDDIKGSLGKIKNDVAAEGSMPVGTSLPQARTQAAPQAGDDNPLEPQAPSAPAAAPQPQAPNAFSQDQPMPAGQGATPAPSGVPSGVPAPAAGTAPTPRPRPAQAGVGEPAQEEPGASKAQLSYNAPNWGSKAADPDQEAFDRHQRIAARLYPSASQGAARASYIEQMMEKEGEQRNKIAVAQAGWGGKEHLAQVQGGIRKDIVEGQDANRNARAAQAIAARLQINTNTLAQKSQGEQLNAARSIYNGLVMNHPGWEPEKYTAAVQAALPGIDPRGIIQALQGQGGQQGAQQQGGQQQRTQLPPQAAKALKEGTVTTFSNGQKWTIRSGQPVQVQ